VRCIAVVDHIDTATAVSVALQRRRGDAWVLRMMNWKYYFYVPDVFVMQGNWIMRRDPNSGAYLIAGRVSGYPGAFWYQLAPNRAIGETKDHHPHYGFASFEQARDAALEELRESER
jgi:hypothetical protein